MPSDTPASRRRAARSFEFGSFRTPVRETLGRITTLLNQLIFVHSVPHVAAIAPSRASRGLVFESWTGPPRWMDRTPFVFILPISGTNTVTAPFGDMAAGISRRTFRCFRHTSQYIKPIRSPGAGDTYISNHKDKALP